MSSDQPNFIAGLFILSCISMVGFKLTFCYKLIANYDIYSHRTASLLFGSTQSSTRQKIDLWDNGIVYYRFSAKFDDWSQSEVRSAMKIVESVSCIKFIAVQHSVRDYVLISPGRGCSSEIGKVGGKQDLYLDTPYCVDRGTVLHEILHTLGLLHEHARPDRDAYININWSNVDEKHRRNFKIIPNLLQDLYQSEPYDYRSIMHYSSSMWSIDSSVPTITPKNPSIPISDLGYHLEHQSLSPDDINKILKLYKCKGINGSTVNHLKA